MFFLTRIHEKRRRSISISGWLLGTGETSIFARGLDGQRAIMVHIPKNLIFGTN